MTVKTVRAFASGLLMAGAICGIAYAVDTGSAEELENEATDENVHSDSNDEQINDQLSEDDYSLEDMTSELINEGYIVRSEDEWQTILDELDESHEEELNELRDRISELEDHDENSDGASVIYRTILTVTPGMTSIDVGQALERANIIDRAMDFFDEVEDQGLANSLKPGTYEVDSEMSLSEVISEIF
ncbi:endolytic transglycosylase MltG [Halalkalibacter sp. APA_J-10(15)]|uniref:endolytic transglycosylase MltG n=1 Tax=unclassified Halalkalibacter TaxID=2893063 RepID=UPI001FF4B028|nr:endolytic transglycosylase MltG [Halalkalibacter sp. APA_J-10(15)]MCK0473086.1 endolytic transglycosylase MltG [Halalkalibacter sp. APA_J-10(15)]